jgi:hypothetical protein
VILSHASPPRRTGVLRFAQDDAPDDARARFKKTLIRVMAVQVVTLLLLGYLQYLFTP